MRRADALRWAAVLCALLACGACAGLDAGRQVQNPTPDAPDPDWRMDDDMLAVRMRSVAAGLEATGYEAGSFARRGFLAAGARATYALTARAGQCLTVVALGAAGINDLDAGIFEADGRAVAQDAASDARPVLRACARGADRRLYYVLHAYQGNGAFLVVAFDGPIGDDAAVEPPAESDSASHSDWTAALVRRGFEPEGPPVELELRPGHSVLMSLPARENHCLAVVAFAHVPNADVNVKLVDESGQERVRDSGPKAWAGVQLCPSASGVYAAEIGVSGASSRVQVARFSGRESRVGGERAMWLGDRYEPASKQSAQVQEKLRAARRWDPQGTLQTGGVEEHLVRLPPSACSEIRGVLGDGLLRVGLRVAAPGRETSREGERGPGDVGLHVCGYAGQRVPVQIEARQGSGPYVLDPVPVSAKDMRALASVPAAAKPLLLDLWAYGREHGWRAPEGIVVVAPEELECKEDSGCELVRGLQLPEGTCVSAAVIASDGTRVPLVLHATGVQDAQSREGFVTRCAHDGEVQLRASVQAPSRAPLSLLRFVHMRTSAAVEAAQPIR